MREAFEKWAAVRGFDGMPMIERAAWAAFQAGAQWQMVQAEDVPSNVRDAGSTFGGRKTDRSRT